MRQIIIRYSSRERPVRDGVPVAHHREARYTMVQREVGRIPHLLFRRRRRSTLDRVAFDSRISDSIEIAFAYFEKPRAARFITTLSHK